MKKFFNRLHRFFWGRDENGNARTAQEQQALAEALAECWSVLFCVAIVALLVMMVWGRLELGWWDRWWGLLLMPAVIIFFPFLHPAVRRITLRQRWLTEEDLPLYLNKKIKKNLLGAVVFVLMMMVFSSPKEGESFAGMLLRWSVSGVVFFAITHWLDVREARHAVARQAQEQELK